MRIKIAGPITPERVITALEAVAAKYGENFGGIYGANLYVCVYNNDGEPLELVDYRGKEIMLSFGVPDGEISRPALSEEAKAKKLARKKTEEEAQEREREESRKYREEAHRKREEMQKKDEEQRAIVQWCSDLSAALIEKVPEKYIEQMNAAIQSVWDEQQPVFQNGKEKGQPRPLPRFEIVSGKLHLHSGKSYTKMKNPVYKLGYGGAETHWKHTAWVEAAMRIVTVINTLAVESGLLPPIEEKETTQAETKE